MSIRAFLMLETGVSLFILIYDVFIHAYAAFARNKKGPFGPFLSN
jgi:hypothetical protein